MVEGSSSGVGKPWTRSARTGLAVALTAACVASGLTIGDPAGAVSTPVVVSGTIATVAGSAGAGDSLALKQQPVGLAATAAGVLVGDEQGTMRLLDPVAHTQTVVAGVGAMGYSGDGGPATAAMLRSVQDMDVDSAGNTYVASSIRVRKITPGGTISTVVNITDTFAAGTMSGVGAGPSGAIYYLYYPNPPLNGRLRVRYSDGSDDPIATTVRSGTRWLGDVAVAADGTLFWTDTGANKVRMRTPGGVISTIAGNGFAGFTGDGGPAVSALLSEPTGLAVDGSDVYVSDSGNRRIRKISGGTITTVAGTGVTGNSGDGGPALSATMTPVRLALRSGTLYFVSDGKVRAIASDQTVSTVAGSDPAGHFSGDGGPATNALLLGPTDVFGAPNGSALVADTANNRIRRIAANGTITTVAGNGAAGYSGDGGSAVAASLNAPRGVLQDGSGAIYIADTGNHRIRKVSGGTITTVAGTGVWGYDGDGVATTKMLASPIGVAVDGSGRLVFADAGSLRVRRIDGLNLETIAGTGVTTGPLGDGGPPLGARMSPIDVAIDGPDLYIAEMSNNRVRKVSGGIVSTVAGMGTNCGADSDPIGDGGSATSAIVCSPAGIQVVGGALYIASGVGTSDPETAATGGVRIRSVVGGVITTVVGDGKPSFSGDGGPGSAARLANPAGLSVDPANGNLLIADAGANRVRAWARPPSTGTISGVVTSGGSPMIGASVGLYPSSGSGRLALATTVAGGAYSFPGLAPASYRLRAWSPSGDAVAEWYVNSATAAGATPVPVTVGATATVNFDLAANGAIVGTVLSGGSPLNGATIVAYKASGGAVATTTSAGGGAFSLPTLPVDTYKLKISAPGYVTEWYADAPTGATAAVLSVTVGATIHLDGASAVTLSSSTVPELSGTVTSGEFPVSGADVRLYTSAGFVKATTTAGDGTWGFTGSLVPGTTYYVRFSAAGYTNEWWNEAGPAFADAAPIAFTGTPVSTINGTLS